MLFLNKHRFILSLKINVITEKEETLTKKYIFPGHLLGFTT